MCQGVSRVPAPIQLSVLVKLYAVAVKLSTRSHHDYLPHDNRFWLPELAST